MIHCVIVYNLSFLCYFRPYAIIIFVMQVLQGSISPAKQEMVIGVDVGLTCVVSWGYDYNKHFEESCTIM